MPIRLHIAWLVVRESLRALLLPVHLLLYLPRQRYWKERAREVLDERDAARDDDALLDFLRYRKPARGDRPHVFLSAGEASGETHAASVMRAVKGGGLEPRWSCFGGTVMEREGGDVLVPLSQFGIMGVSGVLRSMPFFLRALARYLRLLRDDPPDLVMLVDYPGLHVIMGRLARQRGIPVVHYIAPQYWGWAPWRMRRYRHCMDATLTIFPFETHFFEREGMVSCEYVGHPLLDHLAAHPPDPALTEEVRARPTLVLLPGSRRAEIETNVAEFVRIAQNLRRRDPDLRVVLPHVDERRAPLIRSILAREGSDGIELHIGPLASWLAGARAVLAKSGTGSLEACLHGAPTVVIYKLKGWLAEWVSRVYVTVPWFASANLVAGREVVPELAFRAADGWRRVEQALDDFIADGPARDRCLAGLDDVRARMGAPGASDRAARWILRYFE